MAFKDPLPKYLLGKHQMTMTVIFIALFSIIAMLVVVPFIRNPWLDLSASKAFVAAVLFFLMGLAIVSLSKWALYAFTRRHGITVLGYTLWAVAELMLIAVLYTTLTLGYSGSGFIDVQGRSAARLFLSCLAFGTMALGIPYLLCAMYFALDDKDNTIRLLNYSSVVSDDVQTPNRDKKVTLCDNSGTLRLSISLDNLFYIEADDNYIKVWYSDSNGTMKQYMLRCRLKTVEDNFAESNLLRCHRKYIVNMDKVQVLSKEKDGYYIDLDLEGASPIPVSKTYEERIISHFNSR